MKTVSDYPRAQYAYIQDARGVLLEYCKTLSAEDLIYENSSFGHGGSIRNLLVHIASCYHEWIANRILEKNWPRLKYDAYSNIDDIAELFLFVDKFMSEFFDIENPEQEIEYQNYGVMQSSSSFKIFSHVISHEFHHKGQILSMSRHLGYTPVDTDMLR